MIRDAGPACKNLQHRRAWQPFSFRANILCVFCEWCSRLELERREASFRLHAKQLQVSIGLL